MAEPSPYPDDSVQSYIEGPWWDRTSDTNLCRGRLIRAFLPHVDQVAHALEVEGRTEPTNHSKANLRLVSLNTRSPPQRPKIPVAAIPLAEGEVLLVQRAKRRPALVLSTGGSEVPKELRGGSSPKWHTNPTLIVVPSFGVDGGNAERRAGWNPFLVDRIRRAEFPQFFWDRIPLDGADESILRFDQVQPVGHHHQSIENTQFRLSANALKLIDEWWAWAITGLLNEKGDLFSIRGFLAELTGA